MTSKKKKSKDEDVYEVINGNILLNSPDYVFVIHDGEYRIKRKDKVNCFDTVVMCSECNMFPAIQLDKCASKNLDDFTLCLTCLADFVNLGKGK